ncbi:GAF domain-containing protein [Saccharophagus degradans]|uniref:GAF domain-containing protein n=1 Tax=Saccharophagus degradans TaxID=86304 RepID=UPI001C084820|nr:GAF domain-containing protein [Saccharophagus degradans]MBU2985093.1 GAF domain-containing protein [Saccharophagus degradans]
MDVLSELDEAIEAGNMNPREQLELICRVASKLITNANLISLWRFGENKQKIISLINYDVEQQRFTEGLELNRRDFPVYFDAIIERELLVASRARTHPVTRGFAESYFEPLDIHSLLDFILHKDFAPIGVICCESKGEAVNWSDEDIENIRMLATQISYCFELTC